MLRSHVRPRHPPLPRPLDHVVTVQDAHRAYTAELKVRGVIVASGPCVPRDD